MGAAREHRASENGIALYFILTHPPRTDIFREQGREILDPVTRASPARNREYQGSVSEEGIAKSNRKSEPLNLYFILHMYLQA
jgi:hypothetical protein